MGATAGKRGIRSARGEERQRQRSARRQQSFDKGKGYSGKGKSGKKGGKKGEEDRGRSRSPRRPARGTDRPKSPPGEPPLRLRSRQRVPAKVEKKEEEEEKEEVPAEEPAPTVPKKEKKKKEKRRNRDRRRAKKEEEEESLGEELPEEGQPKSKGLAAAAPKSLAAAPPLPKGAPKPKVGRPTLPPKPKVRPGQKPKVEEKKEEEEEEKFEEEEEEEPRDSAGPSGIPLPVPPKGCNVRDPKLAGRRKRLRVVPLIKELQENWGILNFHERSARLRQISPLLPPGSVGQSFLKVVEEPCSSCEDRQRKARPVFQAFAKGYLKRAQVRARRAKEVREEKKRKKKAKKAKKAAGVLLSEEEAEEASDEEEGGETAPPRPLGARDRRSPTPEDSSDEGRSVKRRVRALRRRKKEEKRSGHSSKTTALNFHYHTSLNLHLHPLYNRVPSLHPFVAELFSSSWSDPRSLPKETAPGPSCTTSSCSAPRPLPKEAALEPSCPFCGLQGPRPSRSGCDLDYILSTDRALLTLAVGFRLRAPGCDRAARSALASGAFEVPRLHLVFVFFVFRGFGFRGSCLGVFLRV